MSGSGGSAGSGGTFVGGSAGSYASGGTLVGGSSGSYGSGGMPVDSSGGTLGCLGDGYGACIPIPDAFAPEPALCGGIQCAVGLACCLLDGTCFDPSNASACPAPPLDPSAPQGSAPCASNADCAADEFCHPTNGQLCLGPGYCQSRTNCGAAVYAVCGCDGNTYQGFQFACVAGVRWNQFSGSECGVPYLYGAGGSSAGVTIISCGQDAQCPGSQKCCAITGICYDPAQTGACVYPPPGTNFPCVDDAICNYPNGYCQGAGCTGPGGCVSASSGNCGVILDPVCGCDGVTYTSADCAQQSAVRVAHTGACTDGG